MTSPFMNAVKQKSPIIGNPASKSPTYSPATVDVKPPVASGKVDIDAVMAIGKDTGNQLTAVNEKVLEQQRFSSSGEMGNRLNSLIKEAKGMSGENKKGIGKWVSKILGLKEDLFANFDTVKGRVDVLKNELQKDLKKSADSVYTLKMLREQCGQFVLALKRDEELLVNAYEQMEAEYFSLEEDSPERVDMRSSLDMVEIRIADTKALIQMGLQMGVRINGMEDTAKKLISSGERVVTHLIPTYLMNFSLYIQSVEQKQIAQTQDNVIKEYNEALLMGGQLASENQKLAAALANKQLISLETIQKDKEILLTTLDEVVNINNTARTERLEYIKQVGNVQNEVANKLKEMR